MRERERVVQLWSVTAVDRATKTMTDCFRRHDACCRQSHALAGAIETDAADHPACPPNRQSQCLTAKTFSRQESAEIFGRRRVRYLGRTIADSCDQTGFSMGRQRCVTLVVCLITMHSFIVDTRLSIGRRERHRLTTEQPVSLRIPDSGSVSSANTTRPMPAAGTHSLCSLSQAAHSCFYWSNKLQLYFYFIMKVVHKVHKAPRQQKIIRRIHIKQHQTHKLSLHKYIIIFSMSVNVKASGKVKTLSRIMIHSCDCTVPAQ